MNLNNHLHVSNRLSRQNVATNELHNILSRNNETSRGVHQTHNNSQDKWNQERNDETPPWHWWMTSINQSHCNTKGNNKNNQVPPVGYFRVFLHHFVVDIIGTLVHLALSKRFDSCPNGLSMIKTNMCNSSSHREISDQNVHDKSGRVPWKTIFSKQCWINIVIFIQDLWLVIDCVVPVGGTFSKQIQFLRKAKLIKNWWLAHIR